jgi:hypothetical protein
MSLYGSTGDMSSDRLSRLLRLGLLDSKRAVDELVAFLSPDGGGRFEDILRFGPLGTCGADADEICARGIGADRLQSLYQESKRALGLAPHREARVAALSAYFVAVAAGIAQHRALFTSRSRDELDPLLLELVSAFPPPWSELLSRALTIET